MDQEDVAPSPGAESVISSKRGVSPDGASGPTGTEAGARKKKKTLPGSRGVANLTPEQLAKKRQNDREAQRAIRQRTKDQIEVLERKIQELTSQQPYQELLAVQRAKEAVEQENAEIKRRLALIIGELQPLVGPSPDAARAYASPAQTYSMNNSMPSVAPTSIQNASSVHNTSTPGSAASPGSVVDASQSQSWNGSNVEQQAKAQLTQQRHDMRHGLDLGPERLGLGFLLDSGQRPNRIQGGANGAQDTPRFHHIPMKHDWTSVSNDQAFKAGNGTPSVPSPAVSASDAWQTSRNSPTMIAPSRPLAPQLGRTTPLTPVTPLTRQPSSRDAPWAMPLKNCPPTCPLDSLLLDFLSERRQRVAEGVSASEVVGPRYPSVSSLLNPANSAYSHPLSKVFTDILSTFPDISTLPERVAVLYIMFLIMRWQISPTQENFERLPEWMHPTPNQIQFAHPAWIDHLPFPIMRDKIAYIHGADKYAFDNFFIPFTTTLRLNWPYEELDTLLESPDGEELMINPVFERHLRNHSNWSLGEAMIQTFPSLKGTCRIHPPSKRASGDSRKTQTP